MNSRKENIIEGVILGTILMVVVLGMWLCVNWVRSLPTFDIVCDGYKIAKTITPQTNFWGTGYYVVATDGNSNMQDKAPIVGQKYCFTESLREVKK